MVHPRFSISSLVFSLPEFTEPSSGRAGRELPIYLAQLSLLLVVKLNLQEMKGLLKDYTAGGTQVPDSQLSRLLVPHQGTSISLINIYSFEPPDSFYFGTGF